MKHKMTIPLQMNRILSTVLVTILLISVLGCAGSKLYRPPDPIPDDRQHIAEPVEREYVIVKDFVEKSITMQIEQSFTLSRQLRHLTGNPKQALNVNGFDEVANSSWFTNRNAHNKMSVAEVRKGPDTVTGPNMSGKWIVKSAKAEGVTPGFHIKDPSGNRYVVKFDPLGYAELATGAEMISTKLFYAAGYNVPENYIVVFHPDILQLDDDVSFVDVFGKERSMQPKDLEDILTRIEKLPDGRIRALASKYIPGTPKGPFAYQGVRKDDPNDIIDHEHRRELRGLKVMAAWLKHTDTKSGNSFDSYVEEEGKRYLRHYLIDFGTTLGSGAIKPMSKHTSHENDFDMMAMFQNFFTFGFWVRDFEKKSPNRFTSVGTFQSEYFHPGRFKPHQPNPAFENCTDRDGFWGAKLVMSFTDEQLAAVVEAAQYSDPEATEYVLNILKSRRDKIGRYWFGRVNPLDQFRIQDVNGSPHLQFIDLSVRTNLADKDDTQYRVTILKGDRTVKRGQIFTDTLIPIAMEDASDATNHLWKVIVRTYRKYSNLLSKRITIFIKQDDGSGSLHLLGIERED